MPLRQSGFLLFLLLCVSWAARSDTGCLKQVFGSYCLGGSIQQLQRQYPAGVPAQKQGDRSAVVYQNGRERTYVMAFKGEIYKVLHTYDPASQSTLKKLKKRLEAKYGAYRDHSHYPAYTRTKAAKIGAIRRGEGELKHVWSSPEQAWRIELEWTRKLGVSLAYLANALDDEQREASNEGL